MLKVSYTHAFIRQLKKLEPVLIAEVVEKVELFKNPTNHQMLKVHKLHGIFSGAFAFSVNYKIRIVFEYRSKNEAILTAVGAHDIYK